MSVVLAIHGGDPAGLSVPLLAIALPAGSSLPRVLAKVDRVTGGGISRALKTKDFKGTRDETLVLYGKGKGPERVMLVGMGPTLSANGIGRAAAVAGRKANAMGVQRAAFWVASPDGEGRTNNCDVPIMSSCKP